MTQAVPGRGLIGVELEYVGCRAICEERIMARVEFDEEERTRVGDWTLCFQRCMYHYDDGSTEEGYRFIYRKENGNLQPARGQARIPDAKTLHLLIAAAERAGWLR